MDEIFLRPNTNRVSILVKDIALINEVLNCYIKDDFFSMAALIIEYGENYFFADLDIFFTCGKWNNPANKYRYFAGIVLRFFSQVDRNEIMKLESKMNEDSQAE